MGCNFPVLFLGSDYYSVWKLGNGEHKIKLDLGEIEE